AGIHIEDQLYPKRAHYHKYVAHAVPRDEFADKIRFACRARDETDRDFVIIARSDTCRFEGPEEAIARINMAADAGADMGMFFPRNREEMQRGPKEAKVPLVYVISRGNRDGRPLPSAKDLADMGYKAAIDALTYLLVSFHFVKQALQEIKRTGDYTGMTPEENIAARQEIEDLVGLERFYEIEEATVEEKRWGKRKGGAPICAAGPRGGGSGRGALGAVEAQQRNEHERHRRERGRDDDERRQVLVERILIKERADVLGGGGGEIG